jgi:hypothetical protein
LVDTDSGTETKAVGRLFVGDSRRGNSPLRRGIFVTDSRPTRADEIVLRAAGVDAATGKCVSTHIILPVPRYLEPRILFDSPMRYLLIATQGPADPSVTLYEMNWERTEDGKGWGVQPPRPLTVVTDQQAVEHVRSQGNGSEAQSLRTWRTLGGRAFTVGGQNWRIVSTSAQRLDAKPTAFSPLKPAVSGSACARLGQAQASTYHQPGFIVSATDSYEDDDYCYLITRGNPSSTAAASGEGPRPGVSPATRALTAGTVVPRDEILIAVYQTPGARHQKGADQIAPAPVASLQFGRYEKDQNRWHIGTSGAHQGWIALMRPIGSGGEAFFGAPVSTNALVQLGYDVLGTKQSPRLPMQAERRQ